jgi:uncharacterized protein
VFALRLERGDPVVDSLTGLASGQGIRGARLQGIGAVTDAELGFYDIERREYDRFRVEGDHEALSILGNLTLDDQGPRVHAHLTLGRRDGSTVGGHLFEAHAGATLELFVMEVPGELRRRMDDSVGLPLIDL